VALKPLPSLRDIRHAAGQSSAPRLCRALPLQSPRRGPACRFEGNRPHAPACVARARFFGPFPDRRRPPTRVSRGGWPAALSVVRARGMLSLGSADVILRVLCPHTPMHEVEGIPILGPSPRRPPRRSSGSARPPRPGQPPSSCSSSTDRFSRHDNPARSGAELERSGLKAGTDFEPRPFALDCVNPGAIRRRRQGVAPA